MDPDTILSVILKRSGVMICGRLVFLAMNFF